MPFRSAHKHDVGKDILFLLHTGSLLTPGMFAPDRIRATLHKFWRLRRHTPAQLRRSLKYLYSRGLIDIVDEEGFHSYVLTDKGRRKVAHFELAEMSIPVPLSWDGKWRLVLFDVPEEKKSARNALSLSLKSMGFAKLQDSVWVHPFPCETQVRLLRHALDLTDHLRLIVAESVENDEALREHFHLT